MHTRTVLNLNDAAYRRDRSAFSLGRARIFSWRNRTRQTDNWQHWQLSLIPDDNSWRLLAVRVNFVLFLSRISLWNKFLTIIPMTYLLHQKNFSLLFELSFSSKEFFQSLLPKLHFFINLPYISYISSMLADSKVLVVFNRRCTVIDRSLCRH